MKMAPFSICLFIAWANINSLQVMDETIIIVLALSWTTVFIKLQWNVTAF